MHRLFLLLAACCLLATATLPVQAQPRTYSGRVWVQAPHVQAMGGAAAAFPSTQSVFFYNPAHLLYLPVQRSPIVLVGVNGAFSDNAFSQYDFFQDRLQPALLEGVASLAPSDQQALLNATVQQGGQRTFVGGDLLLPSFALNRKTYGFGGGLFATTEARYLIDNTDPDVPALDFFSQADLMVLATGAVDIGDMGLPGLSLGVTGKFIQRYLLLKSKPIQEISGDENYHVLGTSAFGADLGVQYRAPIPGGGNLYLGAALYDAASSSSPYRFRRYYTQNNADGDPATLNAELALAEARLPFQRTHRFGAAYQSQVFKGPVRSFGLAVDYVDDPGLAADDGFASSYRIGLQIELGDNIALRGGLRQGHPTVGGGLHFDFMQIDYAYHNLQEPGLPAGWHHAIQITLGSF